MATATRRVRKHAATHCDEAVRALRGVGECAGVLRPRGGGTPQREWLSALVDRNCESLLVLIYHFFGVNCNRVNGL